MINAVAYLLGKLVLEVWLVIFVGLSFFKPELWDTATLKAPFYALVFLCILQLLSKKHYTDRIIQEYRDGKIFLSEFVVSGVLLCLVGIPVLVFLERWEGLTLVACGLTRAFDYQALRLST